MECQHTISVQRYQFSRDSKTHVQKSRPKRDNCHMTLRDDLDGLISSSHDATWETFDWVRSHAGHYGLSASWTARWQTPGEPAFVSNLLEHPANRYRLGRIIHKHLHPIGLSRGAPIVSGVFIHQKPKVQFQGYRGHIELGDLLLVRQHFQSGVAAPQGRAFLMQAKSSGRPDTGSLSGKEAQQFALYADWSKPFLFPHKEIGNPPDGSSRWSFQRGPAPYANSGVYGVVANTRGAPLSFPNRCPWAIGYANAPAAGAPARVNATLPFAEALEGFLLGRWGRSWDAIPPPSDHWSSFIMECLRAASTWSPYPVQRIGGATTRERRRDVLALVHSLATLNTRSFTEWRWPSPLLNDVRDSAYVAQRDTLHWERSLNVDDNNGDKQPPRVADDAVGRPRAGLSVLYVATFGEGPLEQLEPRTQPLGSAQADLSQKSQDPNWGAW
jgi:hypothetical protein